MLFKLAVPDPRTFVAPARARTARAVGPASKSARSTLRSHDEDERRSSRGFYDRQAERSAAQAVIIIDPILYTSRNRITESNREKTIVHG